MKTLTDDTKWTELPESIRNVEAPWAVWDYVFALLARIRELERDLKAAEESLPKEP